MDGNNSENGMTETYLRVTNAAGEVAKVVLPVQEGDDLWSAIDRAYPEAWDVLEPKDIEVCEKEGEVSGWIVSFMPGEGKDLAEWFCEIPETLWREVLEEADLGEWDEGRDMEHPIQPGKWHGFSIQVVYEVPSDADTWDWSDEDWLAAVESVRVAEVE